MKILYKLLSLMAILSLYACERCGDDIVVTDYQLSNIAKSFLPTTTFDTLTYTNGSIDMVLYTEEGKVLKDTTTNLKLICAVPLTVAQYEVAQTEFQYLQYFSESEDKVIEYGIEFSSLIEDEEVELDSVVIWENFFLTNYNENDIGIRTVWRPLNDVQNEYTINRLGNSKMISDTILNGISYQDLFTATFEETIFYSKTEGVVAFEYNGDTWYLKE